MNGIPAAFSITYFSTMEGISEYARPFGAPREAVPKRQASASSRLPQASSRPGVRSSARNAAISPTVTSFSAVKRGSQAKTGLLKSSRPSSFRRKAHSPVNSLVRLARSNTLFSRTSPSRAASSRLSVPQTSSIPSMIPVSRVKYRTAASRAPLVSRLTVPLRSGCRVPFRPSGPTGGAAHGR